MTTSTLSIARTIAAQIGTNNMMCFGANRMVALPETESYRGGLEFHFTNCRIIPRGKVIVELNYSDTYTVTIQNVRGREVYKCADIYCDQLFDILHEKIGS